ncbi:uncharacterized protein [Triticum aestivum]|uniref:uncharacterized protein n=1 Tax=Triticum aestivum TaxID=4565 RepID=UPI001D00ABFC|nr:uncharacterized protein LOC123161388 [Triticum aestivum]
MQRMPRRRRPWRRLSLAASSGGGEGEQRRRRRDGQARPPCFAGGGSAAGLRGPRRRDPPPPPPAALSLTRATAVCKLWGRLAASPDFRRRFREHHCRKPPILGVFEKQSSTLLFIPALDPPDRIPAQRLSLQACRSGDSWRVLGCRAGRILVVNWTRRELLVFDPVSGDRLRVAFPPDFVDGAHNANGAVLCDEKSPLKLVFVSCSNGGGRVDARIYSSAPGSWGDIISTTQRCSFTSTERCSFTSKAGTFVGNCLYWWLPEPGDRILELNLDTQSLAVIKSPSCLVIGNGSSWIIRGEDGAVGLAVLFYPTIEMWNRKVDSHGVAKWVLHKSVNMDLILDLPSSMQGWNSCVLGYAEDANAILISVDSGRYTCVFTVQLESMQCKQLDVEFQREYSYSYHPFDSVYTAGPSTQLNNGEGAGVAET